MGILYNGYGAKRLMSLNEPFKEYMAPTHNRKCNSGGAHKTERKTES